MLEVVTNNREKIVMKKEIVIPQIKLERYLLGELSSEETMQIETCLLDNPELDKKIQLLRSSNEEILATYPPDQMTREISLRAHTQKVNEQLQHTMLHSRKPLVFLKPAFGIVLSVMVLVTVIPFLLNHYDKNQESVRIKGLLPTLTIYRQHTTAPERLHNLSIVKPGDVLQLGYIDAGYKYGVIFSCDGNKTITLHYPESDSVVPILKKQGEAFLQNSYILDDAPQFEQFFFVTSNEPISVSDVLKAGEEFLSGNFVDKKSAQLNLPPSLNQYSCILQKEKL